MGRSIYSAVVLVFVATLGIGSEGDRARLSADIEQARRDLLGVEQQLDALRRLVPADFDPKAVETTLLRLAEGAELPAPAISPVKGSETVLRDGRPVGLTVHHVEVTGRSAYAPLHLFLSMLSLVPMPLTFDSLEIQAADGDTVSYRARLALPVFASLPDVPPPAWPAPVVPPAASPEAAREAATVAFLQRELQDLKARADARRALVAMALEVVERRRTARLGHALGLVTRELDEQAVALTGVRAGPTIVVEGAVLGALALEALRQAFVRAGLAVGDLKTAAAGRCQRFVATVRLETEDPPFVGLSGNGLFDDRVDVACAVPATARLQPVTARGGGPGPLTLDLGDTDVAELFKALHEKTAENFLLDAGVAGHLTVRLERASLDEALAAIAAAGLRVSAGPLRRVSLAATPPAPPSTQDYTGEPITLSLRHGALLDILRLMEEVTGLPMLVPPRGLDRRVSLFARELPWDLVLDSTIAAAGLARKLDQNKLYLGPADGLRPADRAGFVSLAEAAAAAAARREWWTRADAVSQ